VVICATSVDQARSACVRELPGLILLDWYLPDIKGDQWIVELRAQATTVGIPIVMMTGRQPSPQLLSLLYAGRIPLLIKPFSLDNLIDCIRQLGTSERAIGAV
jgi:two-component system, OmpR family, phosphate regulon response regulator PhoB